MKNKSIKDKYLEIRFEERKALDELDFAYMINRVPESEYCRISKEIKEETLQAIKDLDREAR